MTQPDPYAPPPQPYGVPQPDYPPAPDQPYTPGTPYGIPGPPPQKPATNKLWLYILIGVLVLALLGFGIYWVAFHDKGTPHTPPETGGPAATPELAVQGYLEALAAGDAEKALAFSASRPSDTTFLTDAVLAKSQALGAISDIQVTPPEPYYPVTATYSIGTQKVNAKYYVQEYGKDYLIKDAAESINLTSAYKAGLGMHINGISLDGMQLDNVYLFPGTYQITTTNPLVIVSPDTFVVESTKSYTSVHTDPTLSVDAQPILQKAAQDALDACLTEKALRTSCGFGMDGLRGNATPNLDTLAWSVTAGSSDLSQVSFQFATYNSTTAARGSLSLTIRADIQDTDGKAYYGNDYVYSVVVDFKDLNNLQVTFK